MCYAVCPHGHGAGVIFHHFKFQTSNTLGRTLRSLAVSGEDWRRGDGGGKARVSPKESNANKQTTKQTNNPKQTYTVVVQRFALFCSNLVRNVVQFSLSRTVWQFWTLGRGGFFPAFFYTVFTRTEYLFGLRDLPSCFVASTSSSTCSGVQHSPWSCSFRFRHVSCSPTRYRPISAGTPCATVG